MKRVVIVGLVLAMVLVLTGTGTVNAESQKTIVTEELVASQYGVFGYFGYGDSVWKTTYSDGSIDYILKKKEIPKPLFIADYYLTSTGLYSDRISSVDPGKNILVYVQLQGVSSVLDGEQYHDHEVHIYDYNTGAEITSKTYQLVASNELYGKAFNLGVKYTAGTYKYTLREYVYLLLCSGGSCSYVKASGDVKTLTVQVGNPQPTPTPTTSYTPTPTPTPTLTSTPPPVCPAGYTYTNGKCAPSATPPSSQPTKTPVEIIISLLSWLRGLFGLSILGASDVSIGAGAQSFVLTTVAAENPHNDYSDGAYSELWGTWMIVDSSQNIVAQKGSWLKLSSSMYSDTATYTFTTKGSYAVVSVVVKVPYTYSGTAWMKGTEAIVGQDKLGVTVKTPAPPATTNPSPPATSVRSILSSLWDWIKSWLPSW